jgi:hypothetical protein
MFQCARSPNRAALAGGRRLPLDARDSLVDASPGWRRARPDCYRWTRNLGIVQRSHAHEDQVRARFGFAKQVGSTARTEPPMHHVPAVGNASIVTKIAVDGECLFWKTGVDGRAARSDVLTEPAPTGSRNDGRRRDSVTHGLAQTSTSDVHFDLRGARTPWASSQWGGPRRLRAAR